MTNLTDTIARLRELLGKATPGPWEWRQSSSGRIALAAPHGGGTVVMDFARKGMQQAEPRFAVCDDGQPRGRRGGILVGVAELIERDPDRLLRHPDAELIAAAVNSLPGLLDEVERLTKCLATANASHEHFEREWYLLGDKVDALTTERDALKSDAARLDWVKFYGARVCWGNDSEVCFVEWSDGGEEIRRTGLHHDWRAAIDEAMQEQPQ